MFSHYHCVFILMFLHYGDWFESFGWQIAYVKTFNMPLCWFHSFHSTGQFLYLKYKAVITVTPIPDLPYERCVQYTQHKLKHAVRVSSFHKQRFLLRTLICYICVYNFMFSWAVRDGRHREHHAEEGCWAGAHGRSPRYRRTVTVGVASWHPNFSDATRQNQNAPI